MESSKSVPRVLMACLALMAMPLQALQTDRSKPLEVNADSTDGTLGDGIAVLRGNVEIRQGTLHIRAGEAEVDKSGGKVSMVTLRGNPAYLEQEIEQQGLVQAEANTIVYEVANGIVTLTGAADVQHPQYQIKGDQLRYDLNLQHFQGTGEREGNGRIHIRLDPELVPGQSPGATTPPASGDEPEAEEAGSEDGD